MGWVVTTTPGLFTTGKENRYPLYRTLGGPQGRPGWVRKISPPPAFDPRTVRPVASRYTDYAIPAHNDIPVRPTKQTAFRAGTRAVESAAPPVTSRLVTRNFALSCSIWKKNSLYLSFEVYTAVWMRHTFFWDMIPRNWISTSRGFDPQMAGISKKTLEDATTTLARNVRNQLPSDTASYPRQILRLPVGLYFTSRWQCELSTKNEVTIYRNLVTDVFRRV